MSWSIKITILYLGFVGIILTLVVTCFMHRTELEYKDYYARELNFQEQIDASNNAIMLPQPIDYLVTENGVEIVIPESLQRSDFTGTVYFMRPSDSAQDKKIELEKNKTGRVTISKSELQTGIYKMQLTMSSDGKNYYKEAIINIK
jgi:nitrogen fixation protein FixH